MRDYAELVKALRNFNANFDSNKLTKDAADAIDELLAEVEHWKLEAAANETDRNYLIDENRKLVNSLMNFRVPTWISVEDELPEKKVGDEGYIGYLVLSDGEYQIADFTHDKYMQTAYEFHVDGEYDPNVTHWMELPPKGVE